MNHRLLQIEQGPSAVLTSRDGSPVRVIYAAGSGHARAVVVVIRSPTQCHDTALAAQHTKET